MLQVPMRLLFYIEVRRHGDNLQECFKRLTHTATWQWSKMMSIANYGWFVIGVVWLLNSTRCERCPGLYRLCLGIVLVSVARLIATLMAFYYSFRPVENQGEESTPKPQGAPQTLIDAIPLEMHRSCCAGEEPESCAVCLNDLEDDDLVRRLPCGHGFHKACVDKWLRQNKTCPLCVQDVETLMREQVLKQTHSWSPAQKVRSSLMACSNNVGLGCISRRARS
jgi:hypothetical protein